MGLWFGVLALAWEWRARSVAIALPLLCLAYVAHALPVVWTVSLLACQWLARRVSARGWVYIAAGCLLGMVAVQILVGHMTFSRWSVQQIRMTSGADQLWVFDGKYYMVLVGLLVVWAMLFLDLLKDPGPRWVVSSIPFQFCVISAAVGFILPTTILLPGFHRSLVYIAEPMALGVGICVCSLLAAAHARGVDPQAVGLVA